MSNVVGGFAYIFFCRLKQSQIVLKSKLINYDCYGDFLNTHMLMLDLMSSILSPCLLGVWMFMDRDVKSEDS